MRPDTVTYLYSRATSTIHKQSISWRQPSSNCHQSSEISGGRLNFAHDGLFFSASFFSRLLLKFEKSSGKKNEKEKEKEEDKKKRNKEEEEERKRKILV